MEKTFIASIVLILISSIIGCMFFLFRTIVNNALSYVKDQMVDLLREVKDITTGLSQNMNELSNTIKENHKEQIRNQTEIAGMKSDINALGKNQEAIAKGQERLEDKVDKHISEHGKK